MKRLPPIVLLCLAVACDRSTPSLPLATAEAKPTPSVALSTIEPTLKPASSMGMPRPPSRAQKARVLRVTDGDTVVLSGIKVGEIDGSTGGRKARLIGVDTPEVFGGAECFGAKASAFTRDALDGRDVLVDLDVDPVDRYDRALVYIWETDGEFFNGRLVAEGFAVQATFPPNVRYVELFTRLARDAREHDRGLWAVCR